MATPVLGAALRRVRRAMLCQEASDLPDGALLGLFLGRRDEAAFEVLVRRHGPMVLGVCRRVLRHEADAEDAFQATFLVLARKAGSVRPRGLVGNWLYGVARNTARKAKLMNQRRRAKEREAGARAAQGPAASGQEWLLERLDEELQALPDKFRAPIVLCDLEGRPLKEAAGLLGCPPATVGTRLARGRSLLARRMARHGTAWSAGAVATLLTAGVAEGVPPALMASTVQGASLFVTGQAASGVLGANVAALTEGVLKAMLLSKLKLAASALTVACAMAYGAALLAPAKSAAPAPAAKDPAAAELLGTWRLDSMEYSGDRVPDREFEEARVTWTFAGGMMTVKNAKTSFQVTFKADPAKKPKQLHLGPAHKDAKPHTAIYERKGDTLTVCLAWGGGPPAEFTTVEHPGPGKAPRPTDGERVYVFKRVKAAGPGRGAAPATPGRAEQLKTLQADYRKAEDELLKDVRAGKVKANKDGTIPGLTELRKRFAKQARRLIDADPKDQVALEAVVFSMQQLVADDSDRKLYELLLAHHLSSPNLGDVVHRRYADEKFLRAVAAKSPHAEVRARAALALAERLDGADRPREAEAVLKKLLKEKGLEKWGHRTGDLRKGAEALLFEIGHLRVGKEAPEVVGQDLDKKPMKLSEYRGKVVLLVFWATWCGPCMTMVPEERELAKRYAGRPFAIVGVNGDGDFTLGPKGEQIDMAAKVKQVVKREGITWRSFRDGCEDPVTKKWQPITKRWNVSYWPTVYVLDHRGVIRHKYLGAPKKATLDAALKKLVTAAEDAEKEKEE